MPISQPPEGSDWDHSSHEEFVAYYAKQSVSEATRRRFRNLRDLILDIRSNQCRASDERLTVIDVGCGAGTLSQEWAALGHSVIGIDVNAPLIEIARERATEAGLEIDFRVASAAELPCDDASADICVVPELLEHVPDWQACLDEFARILRPDGLLYLSTTNALCPRQQEFNLPLYSWYPARLKRHYEQLARTTRPELANFARYPAVNWFTYYSLRRELRARGFAKTFDRFDLAARTDKGAVRNGVLRITRSLPPLRMIGQMLSPGTRILAIKGNGHELPTESR